MFRYKAKLSPSTARRADAQLNLLKELYNAAIEERTTAWKRQRKSITLFDQILQVTDIRNLRPEFAGLDSQMTHETLKDVDAAFQGFFRRVKAGQKPGHPRFRGRNRFNSCRYRQTGWKLTGRRLVLRGIGTLRLFRSRPVEGNVRLVTLKRDSCGDWWVIFNCSNVPEHQLPATNAAVGIDLGLNAFIATSNGRTVMGPHPYRQAQAALRRGQRIVAKRKRGGSNRRKAGRAVARLHRRTANVRRDFLFKTALDLVRRYDVIAVEDLNVRGMARGMLAKSVHDAGWAEFINILRFKAEEAGRVVVMVNPRGTSQACSGCGCEVRKTLAVRTHHCTDCGLVLDRDVNAARNILTLARAGPMPSGAGCKPAA